MPTRGNGNRPTRHRTNTPPHRRGKAGLMTQLRENKTQKFSTLESGSVSVGMNQERAPYFVALEEYANSGVLPFHTPGHMQGRGASAGLLELMGEAALRADATEVYGFDNVHRPVNNTGAAQELASEAYGCEHTWFLVNGSSCGNIAMVMAAVGEGEEIILPRCAHRSVYAGLVMSGAVPVYANTPFDAAMGVSHTLTPAELERLLTAHPRARAVLFTNDTPYGAIADSRRLVEIAHAHHIPVLVDEAWGPHLGFARELPGSALGYGADLVVHSAHKLLGALTQASMLHWHDNGYIERERVTALLRMLQSTSPSCLLTASLDVARRQLALHGAEDWRRAVEMADYLREEVSHIPRVPTSELVDLGKSCWARMLVKGAATAGAGMAGRATAAAEALDRGQSCRVLSPEPCFGSDPTRIVLPASDFGLSGTDMERILREEYRVQVEMSDALNVVLLVTPAHSQADIEALLQVLRELARARSTHTQDATLDGSLAFRARVRGSKIADAVQACSPGNGRLLFSPREAFAARKVRVPVQESLGRACAELITPYPPGVPLICPGEEICQENLDYLAHLLRIGVPVEGIGDESLLSMLVIA